MFLGLAVNGIVIPVTYKNPRNFLWLGHGFKSSNAATAQLVLAGTVSCPSPILSHTATGGRTHSQLLLCEPYLCMPPAVLSGLCGSLKSRCFSARQKMPENKRGQGKADPVKTCCQSQGCPDLLWLANNWNTVASSEQSTRSSRWKSYYKSEVLSLLFCPAFQGIFH